MPSIAHLLKIVARKYRFWRHGRGFGIHSPFAFRFITETLNQSLPYYAYAEIGRDKRLRLLFRVVLAFAPHRVAIVGESDDLWLAIHLACPAAEKVELDDCPDFVVSAKAEFNSCAAKAVEQFGCHAFFMETPSELPFCRMTFCNGKQLVIANYKHLPHQDFCVKF